MTAHKIYIPGSKNCSMASLSINDVGAVCGFVSKPYLRNLYRVADHKLNIRITRGLMTKRYQMSNCTDAVHLNLTISAVPSLAPRADDLEPSYNLTYFLDGFSRVKKRGLERRHCGEKQKLDWENDQISVEQSRQFKFKFADPPVDKNLELEMETLRTQLADEKQSTVKLFNIFTDGTLYDPH